MNSNLNSIKHETTLVTSTINYTIEKDIKESKTVINFVVTIMNGLLNSFFFEVTRYSKSIEKYSIRKIFVNDLL